MIDESKTVQTTPIRTYCKRNRPLPYYDPNCRTPWHWKFTQGHRTTRPPQAKMRKSSRNISGSILTKCLKADISSSRSFPIRRSCCPRKGRLSNHGLTQYLVCRLIRWFAPASRLHRYLPRMIHKKKKNCSKVFVIHVFAGSTSSFFIIAN